MPFGDEAGKKQHAVIRHTCVLSEGSSGSALLNEDLEIVGINLGGGGIYYGSIFTEWPCPPIAFLIF